MSIAGNEFSVEIIQLQLPTCLILSCILILVCLLQPCQEMDVAALGFVQITKRAHKCFYLARWSRTLKWKLDWPKQKRFLIHVILLVILCKYMGVGTIHGTEVLFDWMKKNVLENTASAHAFHPLRPCSSGTVRTRAVFWVHSTFQRIFFLPCWSVQSPFEPMKSLSIHNTSRQEFWLLNSMLCKEPFSFIESCCLLPLKGLNICVGRRS